MGINYNNVNWSSIFYYNPKSPSGLSWLVGPGWRSYDDVAGSKAWNDKDKTKPKCWDVRSGGRLHKAHRIIWILHNGEIDDALVITDHHKER